MLKRLDQSQFLIRLLRRASTLLARQRGLPLIVGFVFIAISFLLDLLLIGSPSALLAVTQTVFQHLGLLIALVGILLSYPLAE
ncbi:MAG: hypothetical protein RML73_08715 [Anaerolineae bacterium]|nr:hypothetical protein [Anaerolineae bacterium]